MNGEHASVEQAKADKIAAARKKLREFESRRINGGDSSSSPVPSIASNGGEVNGRQSVHSLQPDVEYSNGLSSTELYQALDQKNTECEGLKKQVADLHVLYSQAYAAYNELAARENGRNSSQGEAQIGQLQAALALIVEEKTELQSRLRAESERVRAMEEEARRGVVHGHTHSSREEERLRDQLIHAEKMIAAHLEEMNSLRRENAAAQSTTRGLQQDRKEAQARFRHVHQEKERLEGEVREMRKEMGMREMYIRQLTGGGVVNGGGQDDSLLREVEPLRSELERTRREAGETIERASVREREMSERIGGLMNEVSELSHSLSISRVRISQLEDEVESARGEIGRMRGRKEEGEREENGESVQNGEAPIPGGISEEESMRRVDETARRITMVFEERMMEEREEGRRREEEKDAALTALSHQMGEMRVKMEIAERRMAEDDGRAGSLHEILQDLQNEKATVSRALTQNRELKEQVIALEDRLVALTEEKLKSELERQALEHELRGLKERKEENGGVKSEMEEEQKVEERREEEGRTSEREKELESQLGVQERMLSEVREELRRSRNENDSMNAIMQQNGEDENQNSIVVELSQAVARVNTLTQENNELRERIEGGEMQQRLAMLETQLRFLQQDNEMLRGQMGREGGGEEKREEDGHESQMIRILQERLASAEEETARVIREGVERMEEMEGRVMEEEMRRKREEEERRRMEERVAELEAAAREHQSEPAIAQPVLSPPALSSPPPPPPSSISSDERVAQLEEELRREREERRKEERVRTALEQENETIADHVVLYQHYRMMMRDKLRAKDDALREAEMERQRISHTCIQLRKELNGLMRQPGSPLCQSEDGESGGEEEEGREGREREGEERVERIRELIKDIQTIPFIHPSGMPKCTQCIGATIEV